MLKTIFINLTKLTITVGLIYWLLNSGKLDLKLLAQVTDYPLAILVAVILSLTNLGLITIRWRKILKSRSETHLPLVGLVKVNWIGQFFSSVLPGSVSGDLIKILYIQKYNSKFSKKFIFASILIDRVVGLFGLILIVGTSSLLFYDHIILNAPAMKNLIMINYALSAGVLLSLILFFFFHASLRRVLTILERSFLPAVWKKFISLWDDLTAIRYNIIQTVLISLLVQFNGVLIFWTLIRPFAGDQLDLIQALAFIPIGLMTLALPIAPSGLGVGHAIFQTLFEFCSIKNGASLFNIYFVITLLVNILGAIPYILSREKK
jgi:hypothetical protein